MNKPLLYVSMMLLVLAGCKKEVEAPEKPVTSIEVQNALDFPRSNQTILIGLEELKKSFPNAEAFAVKNGATEQPSQLIAEGPSAGLMVLVESIGANEKLNLSVEAVAKEAATTFTKRTQAEISIKEGGEWKDRKYMGGTFKNVQQLDVPAEHTDHSWYIRYEGPGWESDLVGYRFYLDWRNATDVFGKTTHEMALHKAGQDGFDSYHEMQEWGMDVLKVGKSLGIGSPAYFTEGKAVRIDSVDSRSSKVLENGAIYSSIKTNYNGWKVANTQLDITSYYSIHAGSRLTHHHMEYTGNAENLATGIGKNEKGTVTTSKGSETEFGYIATYGEQSLNNDKLGLAVLFPANQVIEITTDQYSDVVVLKPENNALDYYFLAAWELEKEGITSEQDFMEYVTKTAKELASPLKVKVVK